MARALECPACGHRHRLDSVPSDDTFRCDNCGQVLKAPSTVASEPGAPPPPARTSRPTSTGAPAPVAPPPRRTTTAAPATAAAAASDGTAAAPVTRTAPARNAAAVSATVAAIDGNGADAGDAGRGRRGARPTGVAPAPARRRVHWYWRMLAWIVAVPLAFVVTAWPAYHFSFITKDDLLDIFVGNGIGRYVRLGIVTVVWALVTALLVQLFVEGGRARAARRRRTRAVAT